MTSANCTDTDLNRPGDARSTSSWLPTDSLVNSVPKSWSRATSAIPGRSSAFSSSPTAISDTEPQAPPPRTPIEHRLYEAMRADGLSPQVQFGVGRFRVDFAFPDVQLAVEADGREWHDQVRDRRRDLRLEADGWQVVRFTGSEINRDAAACARAVKRTRADLLSAVRYTELENEPSPEPETRSWWSLMLDRLRHLFARPPWSTPRRTDPTTGSTWWNRQRATRRLGRTARREPASGGARGARVVQVIAPAGSGKTTTIVVGAGAPLYAASPRTGFCAARSTAKRPVSSADD